MPNRARACSARRSASGSEAASRGCSVGEITTGGESGSATIVSNSSAVWLGAGSASTEDELSAACRGAWTGVPPASVAGALGTSGGGDPARANVDVTSKDTPTKKVTTTLPRTTGWLYW